MILTLLIVALLFAGAVLVIAIAESAPPRAPLAPSDEISGPDPYERFFGGSA